MHDLSEGMHNNKNKLENINTRVTKLLERSKISNPRHMLKKLIQDIDNLEKFYTDRVIAKTDPNSPLYIKINRNYTVYVHFF
jgi:hypothetical protein